MRLLAKYSILTLLSFMQGCFTGIESTPRISDADVRREHITLSPEQTFMADIVTPNPSRWRPGKAFYITDPKIALILSADSPIDSSSVARGTELLFDSVYCVTSVTGHDIAALALTTGDGRHVVYRTDTRYDTAITLDNFEIPFAIDRDVVAEVGRRLVGNRYYVVTPMWYDADGVSSVQGLRHVPVDVVDVVPGDAVYPLRVVFKPVGDDKTYSLYMTYGTRRSATRNFDTILAFTNPRERYPSITDDTWDLIIHSKVRPGMTKAECRLALGAPKVNGERPTTAGMVEYWSYSDGVFLLFEEGVLSSIRR